MFKPPQTFQALGAQSDHTQESSTINFAQQQTYFHPSGQAAHSHNFWSKQFASPLFHSLRESVHNIRSQYFANTLLELEDWALEKISAQKPAALF